MQANGEVIGHRYQLTQMLGKGGMGAVFQATDRLTGNTVALKRVLIPPEHLRFNSFDPANDFALSLAQEFRLMASLRHPNVNSVLDYGFDEARQPYFTMDLLREPLSVFKASWKSDADKVDVLIQLLQALAYLHRRGIIHRDLKPGNILVVGGQVKVLDFGLSVKREQAGLSDVAGTLGFIAPEVLMGDPPSEETDLYAVGVIAFEMFSGRQLFDTNETSMLIENTLNALPDLRLISHHAAAAVIGRLLAKNPDDRYPSAGATIEAFCAAFDRAVPPETVAIRESFLQTARFTGRERELNTLIGALGQAINGKGGVWLVSGESGSGKTRLLDELRTQALVLGVQVIRGKNVDQGGGLYQMWRAALRWLCLETPLSAEEESLLKAVVPDIADLLGHDVPDAPIVHPLFAQERLRLTIERVVIRQQRPILLILEDLHWADDDSLELLNHFIKLAPSLPLLIVASYRDDERPDLAGYLPDAQLIALKRLNDDDIARLSESMLGEAGRHPNLLALLRHETEGNAFFLVEVMRTLAEQAGQLDHVGEMALPDQVSAQGIDRIIHKRLDRVPDDSLPLLQVAAVIGRQLDLKMLHEFADGHNLEHWAAVCVNCAVLETQDDGAYQFSHDKLRDGVIDDMPGYRREKLHRAVAETLEAVYLYAPDRVSAAAFHWAQAGDHAKEAHYAAQVGKMALTNGAYQKAVVSLERALALRTYSAESDREWATLKRLTAEAYLGIENTDRAQALYEDCLHDYQAAAYRWGEAAVLNDLGTLANRLGDPATAGARFREALRLASGVRAQPLMLAALIGLADLQADRGERESAAELVGLVRTHSSTDQPTLERADRLRNLLRTDLDPVIADAAEACGEARRLSEVTAEILG